MPGEMLTVLWSICSFATNPDRLSWTISLSFVNTPELLDVIPVLALTDSVLVDVRSPPPDKPLPADTDTLEWSMCSLATNPDKSSWTIPPDPAKRPEELATIPVLAFTKIPDELAIIPLLALTANVLVAVISPPPVKPLPAVTLTELWLMCSFAIKLLRPSWSISPGTANTPEEFADIPVFAFTANDLEAVISPPPDNPLPAESVTPEWSICSLAS